MRKFLLVVPLLVGFAFAQTPDTPALPNVAEWFASTAALAVIVAALVAFIKAHIIKGLDGLATVLVSLVVGGLLGLAGHALGFLADGLMPALGFGVSAGLVASGGWDAVAGLLGKRKAAGS